MTKAALNHQNGIQQGIYIPQGFDYVSGNRFSGKNLKIRDQSTGSIYIWINSALAVKKINRFLVLLDNEIEAAEKNPNEKTKARRLIALKKASEFRKSKLALRSGTFYKEGTAATFRM